jgi:hypothetical protein
VVASKTLSSHSRLQKWIATDVNEMYTFLGLFMLIIRNRKVSMEEHWSKNKLLHSCIVGETMSRNRFSSILSMLHMCNNEEEPGGDTLFKLKNVIEIMKEYF